MRHRDPAAGLTLIEVMIVLVIIGIAGSAAVIGGGALRRDARAAEAATRLAAVLGTAADRALVSGAARRLDWTPDGYALHPGGNLHRLAAGVTLRRADGGTAQVSILPDGLGGTVTLVLTAGAETAGVTLDGLRATVGAAP